MIYLRELVLTKNDHSVLRKRSSKQDEGELDSTKKSVFQNSKLNEWHSHTCLTMIFFKPKEIIFLYFLYAWLVFNVRNLEMIAQSGFLGCNI